MLPQAEIDQIASLLRSGPAFQGMPHGVAVRIAALMSMIVFRPGEKLTEDESSNQGRLMLLVSGEAEISSRSSKDGSHLVHRVAQPGHIIGEVGFIDGQAHSATCEALVNCHVAVLSRSDFIQMFEADALSAAQLMAGLLRLLARRIRHANRYMVAQDQQVLQLQAEMLSLQKAKPLR
ncbi:MAG: cyclic nucleotide-binding domain-containing protein [Brachymonas sp.]|nr:cyclic nucleotide-binding domain-containing protein [Brachymonas sp.]